MKLPKALSEGEETLQAHLKAYNIPFEREFKFCPARKWRADFQLRGTNVLVEVEGGGQNGLPGRHQTRQGFANDLEKYNTAVMLGFSLLRFSTEMVRTGEAIDVIREFLGKGDGNA